MGNENGNEDSVQSLNQPLAVCGLVVSNLYSFLSLHILFSSFPYPKPFSEDVVVINSAPNKTSTIGLPYGERGIHMKLVRTTQLDIRTHHSIINHKIWTF